MVDFFVNVFFIYGKMKTFAQQGAVEHLKNKNIYYLYAKSLNMLCQINLRDSEGEFKCVKCVPY